MSAPVGRASADGSRDLTLPANGSSPRAARRFLTDTLRRSDVGSTVADRATLLTSELVTNAVRYGRGLVTLTVCAQPPAVRVVVHDDNPALPTLGRDDDHAAEGGRGLRLVEALATRWGTDPHPPDGKDVWFEIDLREP